MANFNAALRQIRRTRQRVGGSTTDVFDEYRPEYEGILEAIVDLAGDPAFDELKQWMIETTKDRKELPAPKAVRKRAREICASREVTVPQTSPLRK